MKTRDRDIELVVDSDAARVIDTLRAGGAEALTTESLTLEEIFVAALRPQGAQA